MVLHVVFGKKNKYFIEMVNRSLHQNSGSDIRTNNYQRLKRVPPSASAMQSTGLAYTTVLCLHNCWVHIVMVQSSCMYHGVFLEGYMLSTSKWRHMSDQEIHELGSQVGCGGHRPRVAQEYLPSRAASPSWKKVTVSKKGLHPLYCVTFQSQVIVLCSAKSIIVGS